MRFMDLMVQVDISYRLKRDWAQSLRAYGVVAP
jgi:hypothetical protein